MGAFGQQLLPEAEIVKTIKMGEDGDYGDFVSSCTATPNLSASFGGFGTASDFPTRTFNSTF